MSLVKQLRDSIQLITIANLRLRITYKNHLRNIYLFHYYGIIILKLKRGKSES